MFGLRDRAPLAQADKAFVMSDRIEHARCWLDIFFGLSAITSISIEVIRWRMS
jgi:hypothetical protein